MVKVEDLKIRDPFVFIEEGRYYLLGTTGDDCWNAGSDLTLYTSTDLKTFESVGKMVDEKVLKDYTQVWAPELHKYKDKYYLIVSLYTEEKSRGSMIFASNSLTGKFEPLTGDYVTPKGWRCLDATIFVKDDTPYIYFSNEWIDTITGDNDGSLFVAKLSDDLKEIVSKPKKIVSGKYCGFSVPERSGDIVGHVAEGPFVLEENGKIALYWSGYTKTGYSVIKNVADSVLGEYLFDKFVFTENGGHGMVFKDLDGSKKITFHQPNTTPQERMKVFELK